MRRLLSQIVEMTGRRPKMLVVDDDPGTVSLIKALFSAGIEIESAASQAQAGPNETGRASGRFISIWTRSTPVRPPAGWCESIPSCSGESG